MTVNSNAEQVVGEPVAQSSEQRGPSVEEKYVTSQGVQSKRWAAEAACLADTLEKRNGAKQNRAIEAMREMRSLANAVSVSISRSNLLREKIKEATRLLMLGLVCGFVSLVLGLRASSAQSSIFNSALLVLVLGLFSTYRSTMIMTKLKRIARI